MSQRTAYATCTLCEATCGIQVQVEGRQVTSLRGDEQDPFSRGHVCPKAIGLRELQDDPDRLRRPLRRTASGFEEIGWDEAYALAAEGLGRAREAGGADAVALYRGNPGVHDFATLLGANVLSRALGSKNVFSAGPTDTWPRYVQSGSMYGGPLRATVPDVDRSDYLLVVGANPLVSNGSLMTAPGIRDRLAALRARGGKLVVVDPRRTETAARADEHHFIVPGSDAAFLLAMAHVLFAEGRVALGRCEDLVNGLEAVERAVAELSPERVAPRCGIAADTIRRLARELSEAPRAATYGRMGTCVQPFGTLASWALDLLAILTGNLDRPGGSMFTNPAAPLHAVVEGEGPIQFGRWKSRVSGLDEVMGELPAAVLAEEIETPGEGQIRALLTVAGNPVRTYPNSERLERALASLDFLVCLDYYRNETTRHADLILPPTGPLERGHYDLALNHFAVRNVAKWSAPALEPEPGARDAWTTALELGRQLMGLEALDLAQVDGLVLQQLAGVALGGSRFADRLKIEQVLEAVGKEPGPERIIDAMLRLGPYGDGCGLEPEGLTLARVKGAEHGLDLGALVPMLPDHLATESGQIELAPERLVADLPRLERWLAEPPSAGLRLINRRDVRSMNSWLHNLPALAKGRDRCTLQIHPDDAAARGLAAGSEALLRTRVGEIRAPVEITTDVMPGVVSLPHGFGHQGDGVALRVATRRPGANVNALTDDAAIDVPSGASAIFGGAVEVKADRDTQRV
ncbi:MAG: molybdopterin-dependent oxidoreductase [Myxococcota bacterium]|nr:molybdopterin-dependent oxidoreductase [Myxococcota bacterium]